MARHEANSQSSAPPSTRRSTARGTWVLRGAVPSLRAVARTAGTHHGSRGAGLGRARRQPPRSANSVILGTEIQDGASAGLAGGCAQSGSARELRSVQGRDAGGCASLEGARRQLRSDSRFPPAMPTAISAITVLPTRRNARFMCAVFAAQPLQRVEMSSVELTADAPERSSLKCRKMASGTHPGAREPRKGRRSVP